jgi:hypothetical protein
MKAVFMGEIGKHINTDTEDEDGSGVEYADAAELLPMNEEIFTAEINKMVAEDAPRLFALCEEIGDRVDAGTAAWGLSFEDGHTELVSGLHSPRTRTTVICHSAERAREWFAAHSKKTGCTVRLVWVDQAREQTKIA